MRKTTFAGLFVIALLAWLGMATSAGSQTQSPPKRAPLHIMTNGWGSLKVAKGVDKPSTLTCTKMSCFDGWFINGRRVVITEKPWWGWMFTGWHGACRGKKWRCVISGAVARRIALNGHAVVVKAKFVPVGPGTTRALPRPIGKPGIVENGSRGNEVYRVRVNSASPNIELSPAAPAGTEYFAANVTVWYLGTYPDGGFPGRWAVVASDNVAHYLSQSEFDADYCPNEGPQPVLSQFNSILPRQSATGYVCWKVAANDASSLELFIGQRPYSVIGNTWFALH